MKRPRNEKELLHVTEVIKVRSLKLTDKFIAQERRKATAKKSDIGVCRKM